MFAPQKDVGYIATEETITVILKGQSRTIQIKSKSHRNDVILALERYKKSSQTASDLASLEDYLAPLRRAIIESDRRFELDDEGKKMYLAGTQIPLPETLAEKIMDFLDHHLPVDTLVKFWESCLRNPHYVAVEELFVFLTENHLPITEDGGFLGYKKLNFLKGQASISIPDDYEELTIVDGVVKSITGKLVIPSIARKYKEFIEKIEPVMVDVHSGKIHQKVGEFVKIERIKLNEVDRRESCGYGLHIGAYSYGFSGDVRVLCKVMPEDVIACNEGQAKLRTCKYQIVSFVDEAKEVKELMVNLSKQEQDVANGDFETDEVDYTYNDWEGETVECVQSDLYNDDISLGRFYYVIEEDDGDILIVDDAGEQSWSAASNFRLKN